MPSGPNTITAWVERLYKKDMYWSELYEALDNAGVEYTIQKVRRAVYLCKFKLKAYDASEVVKEKFVDGMSIETITEICQLEELIVYAAIKRLGLKRPKLRYRMNSEELIKDLMLLEIHRLAIH